MACRAAINMNGDEARCMGNLAGGACAEGILERRQTGSHYVIKDCALTRKIKWFTVCNMGRRRGKGTRCRREL